MNAGIYWEFIMVYTNVICLEPFAKKRKQKKNDLIVIPCTCDSPELCSMHISINYKVI